jgi:hypothetical protein
MLFEIVCARTAHTDEIHLTKTSEQSSEPFKLKTAKGNLLIYCTVTAFPNSARRLPSDMPDLSSMTATELRASFALAGIFGLRMLGMFIILPVFALYAEQLRGGADHYADRLGIGAYGLTQALLQIPFGHLSDRWGRKRTIYLGLRSLPRAACAPRAPQSVYMVILGRVIQGAGAVSRGGTGAAGRPHARRKPHQGDGDHRASPSAPPSRCR